MDQLTLELSQLEKENYLGTIKIKLQIKLKHPTGDFSYSANDIWFEESQLLDFVSQIDNSFINWNAAISDLNDFLKISIERNSDINTLTVCVHEPLLENKDSVQFQFNITIGNDSLLRIKHEFTMLGVK